MGFFQELRRRKVIRVAVVYAITAWLLVQITAILFPMFDIPDWASRLVVILLAIGFRIRPLLYMGTAFLVADMLALVVRGSLENQNLLAISGIGLGIGVIVIGAIAERNRELVLQRLRKLSATLESWN